MSRTKWRELVPALFLSGIPAGSAIAQELPEPLPPLPPGMTSGAIAPVAIAPQTVLGSSWMPPPVDPVTLARHQPKFFEKKVNSFHWRRLQGKALGYPEEFVPRPLGAAVYDHGRNMVAHGEAARLTLYNYDFVQGESALNPRGLDQLARHAYKLAEGPFPLVIEPTPDQPTLAFNRRLAILNATATWPVPISPDRIVVGRPRATGLSGVDAQIIGTNAMDRTAKFGPPIPIQSNGVNSPSGVTGQ